MATVEATRDWTLMVDECKCDGWCGCSATGKAFGVYDEIRCETLVYAEEATPADLQLMASAPTLLEACQEAAERLREWIGSAAVDALYTKLNTAIQQATKQE
ncbi:MAG TPA: hypothetical protein VFT99_09220 [Roseiflexaceae bacterium]|nr:hypothetical protein [Roseiflexaceae bacterium]